MYIEADLDYFRSPDYDANVKRYGEHSNTCFLCGKRTASSLSVHYTTNGYLTDYEDHPNSQGGFPVGRDCAKKLPKSLVIKG